MSVRVSWPSSGTGSGGRGTVRPERVRRAEARVVGIQALTSSRLEADPATAAVPALWRRFEAGGLAGRVPDRAGTRTTCAVYSDYQEGDGDGRRFRCLVGVEVAGQGEVPAGMAAVTVPAGDYLVFAARGPMPEALAATWARVAEFFEHAPLARAFTADLEVHYPAGSAVDVLVAVAQAPGA
jgi:predicted transcriptional regulator YdeE